MSKIERLNDLIYLAKKQNIAPTKRDFSNMLGYASMTTLSAMLGGSKRIPENFGEKVKQTILPRLNLEWWETGNGEMLEVEPSQHINNVSGVVAVNTNNTTINNGSAPMASAEPAGEDDARLPVIPRHIYEDTEVDVLEYVTENVVPTSPRIRQLPPYSMCYQVYSDELIPEIVPGDRLYIKAHTDIRKIIDGKPYVLETSTNGLMLRTLYKGDTGLRAATKSQKYRDEYIPYEDIVRVYRILGMLRANL